MIKNYIKIALRNLLRHKLFSLINISGLAIGLAVCMLIMLYVAHEHSYDKFHKNANRIYVLNEHFNINGQQLNIENMSYVSGPMIQQSVSNVSNYVRIKKVFKDPVVENPELKTARFSENKMLYADANFFNVFSFKLISGLPSDVLIRPFSLVISKDMAKKYFGTQDPIGKTLKIRTDSTYLYHITGVAENVPSNSSIEFNFIASNSSLIQMTEAAPLLKSQSIQGGSFKTYLLLKHPQDSDLVKRAIQLKLDADKNTDKDKVQLVALADTHLNANFGDSSNTKYLKVFPFVASLILLLALVNYMSLSTARGTLRAKEVGVRKVTGASRWSLAMQFYTESALFALLSFILGYGICYLLKTSFLNALQLKIDSSFLYSNTVLLSLSGLLVLSILIAGTYPSIVLSAFKPTAILKGKMSKQEGGSVIRKVFTTLQFAISVGLVICGIIIDRQLYYFRHLDTGVNRENVIMIPISQNFGKQYQSFKSDVKSLAGIGKVATAHYPMYKGYDMFFMQGENKDQNIAMPVLSVDEDFMSALNIS